MKKRIKIILIFLLAVFLVTIVSTFGGVKVFKKSDLNIVSCGWPLSFVAQDQSWRDPPYPYRVPCPASPLESPTEFYWERFVFDVAFFYLLIMAVYYYWKPDRKENTEKRTKSD